MPPQDPAADAFLPSNDRLLDWFAWVVVAVLGISTLLVAAAHVLFVGTRDFVAENGLLENLQQLWIVLAGIAFSVHVFMPTARQPRARSLILVAICITFLLRETDVATADKNGWLVYWLDESGKKVLLVITWLAVIFYVSRRPLRPLIFENVVLDVPLAMLAGAAGMLFLGWAFDREYFIAPTAVPIEEQSELVGYAMMLLAGISSSRRIGMPSFCYRFLGTAPSSCADGR